MLLARAQVEILRLRALLEKGTNDRCVAGQRNQLVARWPAQNRKSNCRSITAAGGEQAAEISARRRVAGAASPRAGW